jgi:hypothetical protein
MSFVVLLKVLGRQVYVENLLHHSGIIDEVQFRTLNQHTCKIIVEQQL